MGTVQNGNANVFRTIAAAVAKHKAAQLVLSIGNLLRPEQIGPVPKNAIILNHAPQLELLKKASMCITHAGFSTVLEALAQGVPQVAIPVTNDQPGVAARISAHKTGLVASLEELTASHLSGLVDEVLNKSMYRDNARKFQQAITKINGLSRAADLLEEAFGLTKEIPGAFESQQTPMRKLSNPQRKFAIGEESPKPPGWAKGLRNGSPRNPLAPVTAIALNESGKWCAGNPQQTTETPRWTRRIKWPVARAYFLTKEC
jgi:hypothetical protein